MRIIKQVSRLFCMGTFIDSTLASFEVISSGCYALVIPFQQLLECPMEVLLCERVNDLRHSLFHLLNCLASQLWCIDLGSQYTRGSQYIIPHRLPAFLESIMPLKNWCSIHARCSKSSLKHFIRFCGIIFPSLKQNFIAYPSSKVSWRPDCIFEIHQLWQSGFSRVYSNCYWSCSFEAEIIKIGQSSPNMYSNNILTFQESTIIVNACIKKSGNLLNTPCIFQLETFLILPFFFFYLGVVFTEELPRQYLLYYSLLAGVCNRGEESYRFQFADWYQQKIFSFYS